MTKPKNYQGCDTGEPPCRKSQGVRLRRPVDEIKYAWFARVAADYNLANARTGNVPKPFTFTGTALKVKPDNGKRSRSQRCSAIGISAPRRVVCTGRVPPDVSSMFIESIPTSITPCSFRYAAAASVRNQWPFRYFSAPVTRTAGMDENRLPTYVYLEKRIPIYSRAGHLVRSHHDRWQVR